MMITRDNYEIYFVDFLDGNLSDPLRKELIAFLDKNPDLQTELDLIKDFSLPEEEHTYRAKTELYKTELNDNEYFNHTAVSILENDATPEEAAAFHKHLMSHPHRQKDFELFKKVCKLPAPKVLFPQKSKLYRRVLTTVWWQRAAAVAAILVLFFSISLFLNRNTSRIPEKDQFIATSPANLPKEPIEQESVPKEKVNIKEKAVETPKEVKQSKQSTIKRIETYPPLKKLRALRPELLAENKDISIPTFTYVESPKIESQQHIAARLTLLKKSVIDNGIAKVMHPEQIKKTFWKTLSAVSGERLIVYEDSNGKVRKINYDSDFLAVSIPVNNE